MARSQDRAQIRRVIVGASFEREKRFRLVRIIRDEENGRATAQAIAKLPEGLQAVAEWNRDVHHHEIEHLVRSEPKRSVSVGDRLAAIPFETQAEAHRFAQRVVALRYQYPLRHRFTSRTLRPRHAPRCKASAMRRRPSVSE
jgi:hypothetical protein